MMYPEMYEYRVRELREESRRVREARGLGGERSARMRRLLHRMTDRDA